MLTENTDLNLTPQMMGEQSNSLKLIKNTKGYNWEIKIMSLDIEEIERINTEFMKRFGSLKE